MLFWNFKKVIIIRGNNFCNEVINVICKENYFIIIFINFYLCYFLIYLCSSKYFCIIIKDDKLLNIIYYLIIIWFLNKCSWYLDILNNIL